MGRESPISTSCAYFNCHGEIFYHGYHPSTALRSTQEEIPGLCTELRLPIRVLQAGGLRGPQLQTRLYEGGPANSADLYEFGEIDLQ